MARKSSLSEIYNNMIMKAYIKPVVEIHDATTCLPVLMSKHDEMGEGQLSNYGNLDFDDLSFTTNKSVWGEEEDAKDK